MVELTLNWTSFSSLGLNSTELGDVETVNSGIGTYMALSAPCKRAKSVMTKIIRR